MSEGIKKGEFFLDTGIEMPSKYHARTAGFGIHVPDNITVIWFDTCDNKDENTDNNG